MKKIILKSNRILLRNIVETDLNDFFYYRSDPAVAKYQLWEPFEKKEALEYIKKYEESVPGVPGEWAMFGIIDKNENKLIGDCSIKTCLDEPRTGEIGCSVSPDYQGRGYAKEALSLILDYEFKVKNMHRIKGITDVRNKASVRLMTALGMRKEGHFIKNIYFKGSWGDEYLFAILQEEWLNKNRVIS